ncbi:diguanylate cyclase [Rubrivivax gelatinosus]|uniref:diguanylate cyclase n=1 Tax=Rubrivivax gelatinosus TaxID=28068 RepID=UPI0002EF650A|nr:diguanylate cyclase [Rubrivivax gelatinosus]
MNTPAAQDSPEAAAREAGALLAEAEKLYYTQPAQTLRLADEALALSTALPMATLATARRVRGLGLSFLGRHAEALDELQAARGLVPAGELLLECQVLRALSIACDEAGVLDAALDWGTQAAAVARTLADPLQLAGTLLSIGVVLSKGGDPEAGLVQYREALALYERAGDPARSVHVLNNMGINCKNLGRHEEALQHLQHAIEIDGRQPAPGGAQVIARLNTVEPLLALARRDEARAALAEVVPRAQAVGYPNAECFALVLQGELLAADGDDAGACRSLERAVAIALERGSRQHVARAHKALWGLHKAAGRYEAALRHHEALHEALHEAERAQFNEESDRKLRALQVQYDLARARHDAAMARLESARLAEQTRTDPLTGVANRRQLDERLRDEYARAARHGHALAVAMIDIDDFKRINDRHGHAAGDAVLREIATLLRAHCRDIDLVARYGGEEFCVVFVEASAKDALRACEAMRAAVEAHDWPAVAADLQRVTLSMGLAEREEADGRQALMASTTLP